MSRNAPAATRKIARVGAAFAALMLVTGGLAGASEPVTLRPASAVPAARVVIAADPAATSAFHADDGHVAALLERALLHFTGRSQAAEAWRTLVSPADVVGLKVFSAPGPNSGTRPAVVAAVARGLLAAGVPAKNIVIWDRDWNELRAAGFVALGRELGVRVRSADGAGFDARLFYDTPLIGNLVFGDLEFGQKGEGVGRKSFVTRLVTKEFTRIISITPLLNHNTAGVAGHLYGLAFGSVDNTLRFENDRNRIEQAVPEIYALPALVDKVVLNVTDALICQYQGGERSLLHYSAALNEIRLSQDPVALDVLSLEELDRQRKLAGIPETKASRELCHNAALLELGTSDLKKISVERVP